MSTNIQETASSIKAHLEQVYSDLDRMESTGMNGRLNEQAPKVTRD
jgi:hypothetical protein